MTDYLDDNKINKMIQSYKNGQAYRNKYYNNRYATDPVFKENTINKDNFKNSPKVDIEISDMDKELIKKTFNI